MFPAATHREQRPHLTRPAGRTSLTPMRFRPFLFLLLGLLASDEGDCAGVRAPADRHRELQRPRGRRLQRHGAATPRRTASRRGRARWRGPMFCRISRSFGADGHAYAPFERNFGGAFQNGRGEQRSALGTAGGQQPRCLRRRLLRRHGRHALRRCRPLQRRGDVCRGHVLLRPPLHESLSGLGVVSSALAST